MWGYLTEFWDKLVAVGEYSIEWFQGVGNAVAGAIGSLFETLIHYLYDYFFLGWWFADSLASLFLILVRPLVWVFNFGRGFFSVAFKTAEELGLETGEVVGFGDNVWAVFDAIPYMNYIFLGVGGIIGLMFLGFIIKKLINF